MSASSLAKEAKAAAKWAKQLKEMTAEAVHDARDLAKDAKEQKKREAKKKRRPVWKKHTGITSCSEIKHASAGLPVIENARHPPKLLLSGSPLSCSYFGFLGLQKCRCGKPHLDHALQEYLPTGARRCQGRLDKGCARQCTRSIGFDGRKKYCQAHH